MAVVYISRHKISCIFTNARSNFCKCHQYKKYEEGKVNGQHVSEYEVLAVEVCNPCRVHTIR